jgi:hypothetical protein
MKLKQSLLILLMAIPVAACAPSSPSAPTPDVVAIRTSAAQTVVAELTLTAAAFTPTSLPTATEELLPTATLIPGETESADVPVASGTAVLCDSLTFDPGTVDVNIPDNSEMTPGQEFVKTWKVKNDGSCAWGAGYGLIYAGYSDRMSGQPQPFSGVVAVGQELELSVQFKAPTKVGEYVSAWQMANDKGIPFGKPVYVKIVVK